VAANGNRAREGPGSPHQYPPSSATGVCSLSAEGDSAGEARWFGATLYRVIPRFPSDSRAVFGQPSNYSLTRAELTAHVRALRRAGWQNWEVRARFDFGFGSAA
jgi:hypothetical protein